MQSSHLAQSIDIRTVHRPCGVLLKMSLAGLAAFLLWGGGISVTDLAATTGPCFDGIAVNGPRSNPLWVQDCTILLAARDTLSQGGRRLIWTVNTPMSKWDGIRISGTPLESQSCGFREGMTTTDV